MVVGLAVARKLETNVTLEFAKLNIKLISQFTKMTTNNNLILQKIIAISDFQRGVSQSSLASCMEEV